MSQAQPSEFRSDPVDTASSSRRGENSAWWRIAVLVALLAVIVRVVFVVQLNAQAEEVGSYDNAGDAKQYIALARNLAEFGRFIDDSRQFGTVYYSLLRPPLYPLLVAPFEAYEVRAPLLLAQAVLGTAIPVVAVLLGGWWFNSRLGAWIAGLMAALSPTGIGMTGQVMADLLFATLFAGSLVAVAVAARRNRPQLLWLAGLSAGMATLVKPAGLYWPFALPLIAWLVFRADKVRLSWRHLAVAVGLAIALPAMWAVRNYHVARVFAVSTVDAQNLRYYLAPQTQEWAKVGGPPGKGKLRRNREAAMRRDENDFGKVPAREIVRRQWSESFEIFRNYPNETFQAYTHNLAGHFTTPFNGFDYQFPKGGRTRWLIGELESITGSTTTYVIIAGFAAASLLPFLPPLRRDPRSKSWLLRVCVLVIAFAYVSGLSGTTYGTGSRILFPAHIAVQILVAAGTAALVALFRSLRTRS